MKMRWSIHFWRRRWWRWWRWRWWCSVCPKTSSRGLFNEMINQFLFLRYSALSDTDDKYTALLQCAEAQCSMSYCTHSSWTKKWGLNVWCGPLILGTVHGTVYGMARHGMVYSVVLTEAINTSDEEEGTRLDPRGWSTENEGREGAEKENIPKCFLSIFCMFFCESCHNQWSLK